MSEQGERTRTMHFPKTPRASENPRLTPRDGNTGREGTVEEEDEGKEGGGMEEGERRE